MKYRRITKCNYCSNRIESDNIGKVPGWVRISKLKPNNICITACPEHHDKVVELFNEWIKKSNGNNELEREELGFTK